MRDLAFAYLRLFTQPHLAAAYARAHLPAKLELQPWDYSYAEPLVHTLPHTAQFEPAPHRMRPPCPWTTVTDLQCQVEAEDVIASGQLPSVPTPGPGVRTEINGRSNSPWPFGPQRALNISRVAPKNTLSLLAPFSPFSPLPCFCLGGRA